MKKRTSATSKLHRAVNSIKAPLFYLRSTFGILPAKGTRPMLFKRLRLRISQGLRIKHTPPVVHPVINPIVMPRSMRLDYVERFMTSS